MEDKKKAITETKETTDVPALLSDEEMKEVNGGHAMGPNVAGVIGTAVAAGVLTAFINGKGEE